LFWWKPAPLFREATQQFNWVVVTIVLVEAEPVTEVLIAAVVVVSEAADEAIGFVPMVVVELMTEAAGLQFEEAELVGLVVHLPLTPFHPKFQYYCVL
jgi:hypothetical protein